MELKHWRVKYKYKGTEEVREMGIDGDGVQTKEQAAAHLKSVIPNAELVSADEGYEQH